jgi:uncharacterized delta-60 repeat protein
MRRRALGLAALVVALLLPGSALAATPGMVLDPGFGSGGLVVAGGAEGSWKALGAALPDGGAIVSGGGGLLGLDGSGAADGAFGAAGVLAPPAAYGDKFELAAFAVDPQGRLLVVGANVFPEDLNASPRRENGSRSFYPENLRMLRYLPDGALDPSFGEAGVVETDLRFGPAARYPSGTIGDYASVEASGVAIDPQGRIVVTGDDVVGLGSSCVHDDFAPTGASAAFVARFDESGALDQSFGDGGVLWGHGKHQNPFDTTSVGEPVAAPDGSIFYRSAGAPPCEGGADKYGVGRLTPGGRVDRSFGRKGALVGRPIALAAGPEGSVFELDRPPRRRGNGPDRVRVTRFAADGKLDRAYGKGGRSTFVAPGSIRALAVDPAGRAVVVGRLGNRKAGSLELLRLSAGGDLETGFGPHGRIATPVPHLYQYGQVDACFDPQGRLLVVTQTSEPLQGRSGIAVVRYLPAAGG